MVSFVNSHVDSFVDSHVDSLANSPTNSCAHLCSSIRSRILLWIQYGIWNIGAGEDDAASDMAKLAREVELARNHEPAKLQSLICVDMCLTCFGKF